MTTRPLDTGTDRLLATVDGQVATLTMNNPAKRNALSPEMGTGLARALDFAAFLRHPHTVHSLADWPAARYVTDAAGQEAPALFIRLEHLAQDIAPFEAHLGFPLALPHANRAARAVDYRASYDDALAGHLGRICAADIARFGYRFG